MPAMAHSIRLLRVFLGLAGFLGPAVTAPLCTAAQNPMPALHARDWDAARADVAGYADPVAATLVSYFRMLTPGAATPEEIAAFMASHPDWPNQAALRRRWQEAIATDPDDAAVAQACLAQTISAPAALARCAAALDATARHEAAITDARDAWRTGYAAPMGEAPFLQHWSGDLRPGDEWARFAHFMRSDPKAAADQVRRLAPADRPAARVWLALAHNAPEAFQKAQALPAAGQRPGLLLEAARYLRRAQRYADAVAFWRKQGMAAEATAGAHLAAFWTERNILARELLKEGDNQGAYAMADDQRQTKAEPALDAAFLAGFIALRRLHDPVRAEAQFRRLASLSRAAITQARAHYWLAQAEAAAGQDPKAEYGEAARYPTTFFGQLAARALGESPGARIRATSDPSYTPALAWDFASQPLVRAAAMLVAWGEPGHARAFLMRVQDLAHDPAQQALAAKLALALRMPDTAVFIARRMGVRGGMLPDDGWPAAVEPPGGVDPAVVLALIRQESSFDRGAISPAGARGLMQLMPGTADKMAQQIGDAPPTGRSLLTDPARNMQLGSAYFAQLLNQFGGSLPLAVAAYNAGPQKVSEWLTTYGDPRSGAIAMVDWIELIPYGETRNYVERVLESVVIYRAHRGEADDGLLAQWMR